MLRAFAHEIYFTAAPATSECKGCEFDNCRSKVCREASFAAIRAGMPDCDAGFIYVRDPSDGRQADLLIGGEA